MKYLRFILLLPVSIWLVGCTAPILKDEVIDKVDWTNQQRVNSAIQHWQINGRIAVQNEDDGVQLDYEWQQQNAIDYNIRLQAPFGISTALVSGRAEGVSIKTSSGDTLFDTDVDRLMLQLNGWPLPIKGLHYWVRGLPSPESDYSVPQWNDNGMPDVILQDGWRIEFRKYAFISRQYVLPRKVFISRSNKKIQVRLIVRKWLLK